MIGSCAASGLKARSQSDPASNIEDNTQRDTQTRNPRVNTPGETRALAASTKLAIP